MSTVLEAKTMFFSVNEAASKLSVTAGRIRQLLLSGQIHGRRLNERAWAIEADEIERYQRERRPRGRPRNR